MAIVCIYCIY